ncbi:Ribosomal L7Ae/L30e/S12e/Gadd45 family protein [Quillaja saponaria]|uniref:Ribosomal L7Ae/L30e/S12e/Gadd45 family protein n=1 Tax=Quillaja saponaria TaxID=32244 RepID=A0AAD7Q1P3_QUISA|nr:Ribosomal L7Ae/L30e/S12e/Gadd45 family protein [Quillaja saponaria]
MSGRAKSKATKKQSNDLNSTLDSDRQKICYEGEGLANLLRLIRREIESARILDGNSLPEKIWFKQQFSIGVNDVTRVLERMDPFNKLGNSLQQPNVSSSRHRGPSVKLQAILVASDCNPRWLTKHLPSLASSRKVPLIFVKDNKKGSLRLGELFKLKTAIAIGVKAKGNAINKVFEEILQGSDTDISLGPDCLSSTVISDVSVCNLQGAKQEP